MTQDDFETLVILMADAFKAWGCAGTPEGDERASRAQQAVQDHCSQFDMHWDSVETAMFYGVSLVEDGKSFSYVAGV